MSKKLCPTCDHALNLVDIHSGGSVRHCPKCGTMTIGTDRHVPTQAAALPKLLVTLREVEVYLMTAPAHRTTGGTLLALVRAALAAFQKE